MVLGGKSKEDKVEERDEKQYQRKLHSDNLKATHQQSDDTDAAEILRYLSNIDDLPIDPEDDDVMGQLVSKLTSTANLSPEQVKSNEWVREYILVLYLCKQPRTEGLHGAWRGWAHGDSEMEREPLSPDERMQLESFVTSSKLALTRSEEFKAVEESTRTVNESVVHNEDQNLSGGGILGRLRS